MPSTQTPSLSSVISTLVPVLVLAIAGFTAFLILRPKFERIYQPRTFLSTLRPQERSPPLRKSIFGGIVDFYKIPDTYVLQHHSIDGYFFLRYLRIGCMLILVGCCITFPILWPVYGTSSGGKKQLETISLSNVTSSEPQPNNRLYASVFVAWVYFGFVWFTIYREMIFYINLRQAYLTSPLYADRISSKTVLFTSVPQDYCKESVIRSLFKSSPPKNVWISTDTKDLSDLVDARTDAAVKLEGAETKLIKTANDKRLKALKKNKAGVEEEHAAAVVDIDGESGSAAGRWVEPKDRPTHRLKPLIGKKVDTINWCREEIARLTPKIEKLQAEHRAGDAKAVGSVFVEFNTQAEAQSAYARTTHHVPLAMAPRFIGMSPPETIWSNLRIKWWERLIRRTTTLTLVILLLLFWAIPVAAVGLISNVYNLLPPTCKGPNALPNSNGPPYMQWLCFLTYLPTVLFGLVQGLLPSVLLAVLMALVPIFLRAMAKLGGAPTLAAVELSTQNWYYAFQVIEVFIVGTLGSAASSIATDIGKNPANTPNLLAQKIPTAANLFMSYVIVQGFSIFWGQLLQIAGLVLFYLLGKFLDNTPRKMYKRWVGLSSLGWGSLMPLYEFFVMICIIYSILSPLVLGWSVIGLYLMYQAFRYNLIFTTNSQIETHGLIYIQALKHIVVALYVAEVTLVGIFAVSYAIGPAILMAAFLVASILFHMSLNKSMGPLFDTLPVSIEVEEQRLRGIENGNHATTGSNGISNVDGAASTHQYADGPAQEKGAAVNGSKLPAPHKKPNFIVKWLKPGVYADFETLRRLVPTDFAAITYDPEIERLAYYDPSITNEAPIVWIPRDEMGISRQEVAHTSKVIDCTDEDVTFDDKGKLAWDNSKIPPIYEEKIYY